MFSNMNKVYYLWQIDMWSFCAKTLLANITLYVGASRMFSKYKQLLLNLHADNSQQFQPFWIEFNAALGLWKIYLFSLWKQPMQSKGAEEIPHYWKSSANRNSKYISSIRWAIYLLGWNSNGFNRKSIFRFYSDYLLHFISKPFETEKSELVLWETFLSFVTPQLHQLQTTFTVVDLHCKWTSILWNWIYNWVSRKLRVTFQAFRIKSCEI